MGRLRSRWSDSGNTADCLFRHKETHSILAGSPGVRVFSKPQSNEQRSWNLWRYDLRARLATLSRKSQALVALVREPDPDLLGAHSELFARGHCSIFFRRPRGS